MELQMAPEGTAVPKGFEVAHLSTAPPSDDLKPLLARFPVTFEGTGFLFGGRTFGGPDDALFLADPTKPAEIFVIGNSERAVLELAAVAVLDRPTRPFDYTAVSGWLAREGRFVVSGTGLAIDASSDHDRIAEKEAFYKALRREKRGNVAWEYRESEAPAVARWETAAARYAGKRSFLVRVFPDAVTKALYTGSSRPADLSQADGRIVVEIDASSPAEPNLIEPALAAAGVAAGNPSLLNRRTLLLAEGARRVGTWWKRDVRSFAAFTHAAGVDPTMEEVVRSSEDASPVLTIGAAAAWLDAGARIDGEAAVEKALPEPEGSLATKLARWRLTAWRQAVKPPPRRPLPEGFLRGVSFAMTNTIEGGYISPASLAALQHLASLAVNSVAILPYGLVRETGSDEVLFVHRSARGETDEGIVHAIQDARSLGMSAMLQPLLWVGGGESVGTIAMADDKGWASWFESYRRYVVHQAVVAEAAGAALFCVGTELRKAEAHEREWRAVIAASRLATGAPVVYAAEGAAGASRVTFWDALDAIGVDFFDPLTKAEKVKDPALDDAVRQAVRPIADVAGRVGKPVLYTESGYPWVKAAWALPRGDDAKLPAGGEDSARAIAAVFRVLGGEKWWRGVYWWRTSSDGKPAMPGDRGYNFLGTPAEKAIADGFRAKASS
ncbi:MAG TPA: hypothetical protein VKG23_18050 [Thermoanaerobaculia bacterium]|nr:hypothetical protein [Thermoanaerobaculia bacterium]